MANLSTPHDRDAALDAGLKTFWQQGYHATSLKMLERATGMHPGSLYAAFKSKDAFFLAALDRYELAMIGELAAIANVGDRPIRALADYVLGLGACGSTPSSACMLVKTLLETTKAQGAVNERANRALTNVEEALRTILDVAAASLSLCAGVDTARTARRIQAEIMGLRVYAARAVPAETVAALAEDVANDIAALERNS
jgi:AcrR family transcriptional regulator